MTERNIFNVVEDVKKTLESDKHYIYSDINKEVYDARSLKITHIILSGEIAFCGRKVGNGFWCEINELITKEDAENKKRKDLEMNRQRCIDRYKGYIEEYKQKIKELEKDNG